MLLLINYKIGFLVFFYFFGFLFFWFFHLWILGILGHFPENSYVYEAWSRLCEVQYGTVVLSHGYAKYGS